MEQFEQILLVLLSYFCQNYVVGHGSWAIFKDT
jgi:hypothetical protein